MTLEETILHEEELEERRIREAIDYKNMNKPQLSEVSMICAEEHRQRAGWLKELKIYREDLSRSRGKWIDIIDYKTDIEEAHHNECSICGNAMSGYLKDGFLFNFCPKCGADMREDSDD